MGVLVIGGAGYIGSHAAKMLCDKGYNVIVYDNLSTGFQDAVDSRSIFVNGDVRDYIHVVDLVDAHVLALKYLKGGGKNSIINLGYRHGFSVKEIIASTQKIVGSEIKKEIAACRAGDPDILVGFNEKALRVLNLTPKHDNIDIIIGDVFNFQRSKK